MHFFASDLKNYYSPTYSFPGRLSVLVIGIHPKMDERWEVGVHSTSTDVDVHTGSVLVVLPEGLPGSLLTTVTLVSLTTNKLW